MFTKFYHHTKKMLKKIVGHNLFIQIGQAMWNVIALVYLFFRIFFFNQMYI